MKILVSVKFVLIFGIAKKAKDIRRGEVAGQEMDSEG